MADPTDQYDPIFREAGAAWNIDPLVLKALASHESGGRADAVGRSGELGLTQITAGTAQHLGMTDRRDPAQQIWGAAKYLSEALTAEHDNPYAALAYYNGGPGWRSNPRRDPNYPSYVGGQYQKFAKASTGSMTDAGSAPAPAESTPKGDAVAKAQTAPAEDDPFTRALNAPETAAGASGGATTAAEPDAFTRALNAPGEAEPATGGTTARGVARNVAAGTLEGSGGAINVLSDPFGNLVGKPLATGLIFAHDALAPWLGYQRFSDADRNLLLGDLRPQIGTRLANAAGASDVVPQSRAEQLTRAGTAGAVAAGTLGVGLGAAAVPSLAAGAGGAVAGDVAAANVPEWAKPAAELAGNIGGGALAAGAVTGLGAGARALATADRASPVSEHPLAPQQPMPNALDPMAARVAQVTGREPSAAAGPPPAEPQPAGAQWSGNRIVGITPAEEAAYRVNAEGGKLIEPQTPGVVDRNAYVEGVNPNLAEQEQQVNTARELKALNVRSTEASQQAKEIAADNNQARTTHLNNETGAETDILRRTTQRQADIQQAKPQVFAPENVTGPVDHVPVAATIEGILTKPENRQNTPVQKILRPLLDRMQNADGSPKILDPQEWWGLRQDIDRMTSPRMQSDDPNLHYAAHQLNEVSNAIDTQIEKVAPGYDAMIAKYAEHSRAIGAMRVLQDEAKKVYTAGGRMTFEGVQRMMKHIVDMRNADPTDLNPYKQISDATMQRLWGLRDDLRRSASAVELAKTPGSDTVQNTWDMIKGLATGPEAQHALHAFAATHFGMPGYVASRVGAAAVGALRSGAQGVRDAQRAQQILRPRNLLNDPYASAP